MATRLLASLALSATILAAPIAGPSAAQETAPQVGKLAYESCYPDLDVWDIFCHIQISKEGAVADFAPFGRLPQWSPDGNRIAYIAYGPELWGKVIVRSVANPGAFAVVASDDSGVYPVKWLTSSRLVFGSARTGAAELYAVNADGTSLVQLTSNVGFAGFFAVSPDGSAIVFARDVSGVRDLFRINPDGSALARLTTNSGYTWKRIEWSPDSSRVLFDCGAEVCSVKRDGSGFAQLTTVGGEGGVVSPDGARLAFAAPAAGGSELVVREADGSLLAMASGTPGHTPLWADDGRSLAFQGSQPLGYLGRCYFGGGAAPTDDFCLPLTGIYVVTADATGLRRVAIGRNPDWAAAPAGEPLASFTAECTGAACSFDARESSDPDGDVLTYSWAFGDGTTGSGATANHTYSPGGNYQVRLTVRDGGGLTSANEQWFYANSSPTAAFTHSCTGATCTFNGSGTDPDGDTVSYHWNFGDGTGGSGQSVSHTFATGTFTVSLFAFDSGGGYATASATVTAVNPGPTAAFTYACTYSLCTFNGSGSSDDGPLQFVWSFGDNGGDSSSAKTTHWYSGDGTYSVTLTVIDRGGQVARATQNVTVRLARLHLGDLDSSRARGSQGWWHPIVAVTVHAADERGVQNALVTGVWSTGQAGSCFTDPAGKCDFVAMQMKNVSGIGFTVTGVTLGNVVYDPLLNHDPDGDSSGATIRFGKQ